MNENTNNNLGLCEVCQYIADKYSFPMPNDLPLTREGDPLLKALYCCCGGCDRYQQRVDGLNVRECDCFEEL